MGSIVLSLTVITDAETVLLLNINSSSLNVLFVAKLGIILIRSPNLFNLLIAVGLNTTLAFNTWQLNLTVFGALK